MKIKTSVQVEADIAKRLAELQHRKFVLSDALNFHEQHSIDVRYSPEAYEQHRVFAGGLRVALDIMEGGRNFELYKANEKVRKENL